MELVGIGDLHLTDDSGRGGLSNYIEDPDKYVMSEVSRVLKWAKAKHIDHALLYGDLCDSPRMSYDGHLAFARTIRAYKDIQFIGLLGNHDKEARSSAVGHSMMLVKQMGLKNFRLVEEDEYIDVQGTSMKFCPWPSTSFDPRVLNVAHIEVRGSRSDSGRKMEDEELTESKAVTLCGHLHTPHKIRNTWYSGTVYQTNFGEPLPKSFHHVQWTSRKDYEITDVPFDPLYKLFNCVVESQADVDALSRDPHHLLKVVIKDGADVVMPELSNVVISKAFKTKQELTAILTEDLMQGQELVMKTDLFFRRWLKEQAVPESLKARATKLRKQILGRS